ncbi:MAG: ATP-grasp domain-containing protein [Bdellovibrionales bacterium]|nr:ATP-grasp domain-containing protein [Bdellovibrionales bacterium]
MKSIEKIAIANRGEVAVRLIRACQELGIETVLLHSEVDVQSLAYRLADETVCIGPAPTSESYLNIEANIQGALSCDADAIHPGFGFLSENSEFARACRENRLVFIGPSPEVIDLFGNKIKAKELVAKAGGPCIPGYQGEDQSLERLKMEAEQIGYPLMVKVAEGGGGRGLRVVHHPQELEKALESAKREGLSFFKSEKVFLEKYLGNAKHIEVQIFGDANGNIYHLMERECSVQRKHQKVIEEACSANLPQSLRQQILKSAVDIAKEALYEGAGTVEFLVQDNQYYFLEMNTRLQVEHPVTEMVLNVDLVKAQILTAQRRSLPWDQEDIRVMGHAIECRLYAEDPYAQGMPSTGRLGYCFWPMGPGRRFEVGFEEGDEITSYYDPMIAKIIVWDENRPRAIEKMKTVLRQVVIFGVKTNIDYHLQILSHPDFVDGIMTTKFIEQEFPSGLEVEKWSDFEHSIANALTKIVKGTPSLGFVGHSEKSHPSPWKSDWGEK